MVAVYECDFVFFFFFVHFLYYALWQQFVCAVTSHDPSLFSTSNYILKRLLQVASEL